VRGLADTAAPRSAGACNGSVQTAQLVGCLRDEGLDSPRFDEVKNSRDQPVSIATLNGVT
jgi:hypothetical protein